MTRLKILPMCRTEGSEQAVSPQNVPQIEQKNVYRYITCKSVGNQRSAIPEILGFWCVWGFLGVLELWGVLGCLGVCGCFVFLGCLGILEVFGVLWFWGF